MIHNEHLRKADETYELRHDNNGNAVHVYIKDGSAILFPTLDDFVKHVYFGDNSVLRYYCSEDELGFFYTHTKYNFYELIKAHKA